MPAYPAAREPDRQREAVAQAANHRRHGTISQSATMARVSMAISTMHTAASMVKAIIRA